MIYDDFIIQGQNELRAFYGPYFDTAEGLEDFLYDALDYEYGSLERRQMLYQVQRFVTLANDIEKLRPGRDCLRMLFIRICLESLCTLSNYSGKQKDDFFKAFVDSFSEEGKLYTLDNFELICFEDEYMGHVFQAHHSIDMLDFMEIIREVRHQVVHEGVYWDMQFFAYDDDSRWVSTLETSSKILKSYAYHGKGKRTTVYTFATTLKYKRFIYYFVEACVNFIRNVAPSRL